MLLDIACIRIKNRRRETHDRKEFVIDNEAGLHARPAARLIKQLMPLTPKYGL